MARQRSAKDLTVDELRQLLIEKRRAERQTRLDHFRRTGRVVTLESDPSPASLENLRSTSLPDEEFDPTARRRSARRIWLDRLLVVIEIGAVFGLIFILLNGINVMRDLNQEVASALVLPTLTPTPIIKAVVLPSGHTSPDSPGGVQPNDAEIPEHLRPLVQTLANLPVPTVGPQQAARIQIPAIGIEAPIVQGDGWEQLKKGVGQHIGTPNPGENGNIVLSAHNDVFGEIFRDLDQLEEGDKVILYTNQRTYTYIVRQSQIVEPTQVEVMAPTKEPVVTLISCYPYRIDNQRIVITAHLESES
jgi:sortase A